MIEFDLIQPNGIQMQNVVDKPTMASTKKSCLDISVGPKTTLQTVTSTKALLPAASLSNRKQMVVRNLDPIRTIRIGSTSITAKIGTLVEPLEEIVIQISSESPIDIYAIATGAEVKVEVIES